MVNPENSTTPVDLEEITLSLEILGSLNPYMESVVGSYHDALEAHERGDDLKQFLQELKFVDHGWNSSYLNNLNDKQIGIVLDGRNSQGTQTDYVPRLGFAIGLSGFTGSFSARGVFHNANFDTYDELKSALKEGPTAKSGMTNVEYFEWSIGSMLEQDISKQLFGNARKAEADGLDIEFDSDGRKIDRIDEINHVMADFCMQLDQPELADSFARQIVDDAKKVSLYFSAIRTGNVASLNILDLFENLKEQLDTYQLVRFLTLEISQQGLSGEIDIADNTRRILTLTNDERIFNSNYRKSIRYKLMSALNTAGQTRLSEKVRELCGLKQVEARETDNQDKKLNRKERRNHRALGKAATRSLDVTFNVSNGLKIKKDDRDDFISEITMDLQPKEYARYALYERGFSVITPWMNNQTAREIIEQSDDNDLRYFMKSIGISSKTEAKEFEELFSSSAEMTPDRKFQEMIIDDHFGPLTKLMSSVVMALKYTEAPVKQLDLEASISAELEELELRIDSEVVTDDVVEQSISRQQLDQQINQLQDKIYGINNVSLRAKYTLKCKSLLKH